MSLKNILKEWKIEDDYVFYVKHEINILVKCHFDRNSDRESCNKREKRMVV
jgi:hypothetical protein